ncbi:MAG TPA: VOC family protein [Spirochaetota bacterium]|nr:VOC family protein [Spirochaetota bacterium]HRZ26144.1 VOC family protein [Spirochaetota bacterium]HSA13586.1 VOC family protein [Spirochaetota bacterium]
MIVIESVNHIGITVSNLNNSINFYKELFDFEIADKSTEGQVFLKMGDIVLCLYEVEGYKNQEGIKNRICFYVDEEDFDDALDELEESEIEIVYGPENLRNGRSVVFLDPDRNQIELSYPRVL